MKKIFAKDRKNREVIKQLELKHFILKQISTNSNFLKTLRWNALYKLSTKKKKGSKGGFKISNFFKVFYCSHFKSSTINYYSISPMVLNLFKKSFKMLTKFIWAGNYFTLKTM